jgi:hypothetical protein
MRKLISNEEYVRLEKEYVREQLNAANPKPSGALGMWAWHTNIKKAFSKFVGQEPPKGKTFPISHAKPSSFSEFWKKTQ